MIFEHVFTEIKRHDFCARGIFFRWTTFFNCPEWNLFNGLPLGDYFFGEGRCVRGPRTLPQSSILLNYQFYLFF